MRKYSMVGLIMVFTLGVTAGAIGCSRLQTTPINDPALLTNGLVDSGVKQQVTTQATTSVIPAAGDIGDLETNEERVKKDFQYDISSMFKAWKAPDLDEFKRIARLGLSGAALENRTNEAQEWLIQGDGADVNEINFTSVKITKLEGNSAEVESEFNYSGYNFNTATETRGEKFPKVAVKRRYQLEQIDNRWLIVSEADL